MAETRQSNVWDFIIKYIREILLVIAVIVLFFAIRGCRASEGKLAEREIQLRDTTAWYVNQLGKITSSTLVKDQQVTPINWDSITAIFAKKAKDALGYGYIPIGGTTIIRDTLRIPGDPPPFTVTEGMILVDTSSFVALTNIFHETPYYSVRSVLDSTYTRITSITSRDTLTILLSNKQVRKGGLFRSALYQPAIDIFHANPDMQTGTVTAVTNIPPTPKRSVIGVDAFIGAGYNGKGFGVLLGVGVGARLFNLGVR